MNDLFIKNERNVKYEFRYKKCETFKINSATLKYLFYKPSQTGLGEPELVNFNLHPEIEISFRTEIKKVFLDSCFIWEGSVPGQPNVHANLSAVSMDDEQTFSVAGAFYLGGKRFVITPSDDGYVLVHNFEHQEKIISTPPVKPQSTKPEPEFFDLVLDENIAVIDALALYPVALTSTIGEKGIKATLGHMQQTANQVFINSGIKATLNFIASEAVAEFDNKAVVDLLDGIGTVDVGGTGTVIKGKYWTKVAALRDAHNADIVVLLGDGKLNSSGSILGRAMSIPEPVRYDQSDLSVATLAVAIHNHLNSDPGITFSHEMGHLLGGKHSRNVQPTRNGLLPMYDYAHAYISPDKSYATMMGYDIDANEIIPAYSAADMTYQGRPIGVAIDKPGAADTASLFRMTVRAMAAYRGSSMSERTQTLSLEVDPLIGGTVLTAEPGPYVKGTVVNVRAVPRAGHTFKHWLLDGAVAGTNSIMSISMDKAHTLRAVFENGKDHWVTVINEPSILQSGGTLMSEPAGSRFPYGTEITLTYQPGKYKRSRVTSWIVDGMNTGVPVTQPLTLQPEQELKIGVELGRVIDQNPTALNSSDWYPGGSHELSLVLYDMWGPLNDQKFTVCVLSDYHGEKGISDITLQESSVVTNKYGVVNLHYNANPASLSSIKTNTAFLSFIYENEAPLVYRMKLRDDKFSLNANFFSIPNRNQYILAGSQPSPVEFTILNLSGKSALEGKITEFNFSSKNEPTDKTGVKILHSAVKSDIHSKGNITFSVSDKHGSGTKAITYPMWLYESLFCLIHVLPGKISDFLKAPKSVLIKTGEDVEWQVIPVNEAFQLFHLQELGMAFSELNLKVEMDDGGTGLNCQNKNAALGRIPSESGMKQGFIVFMSKASANGTARMRLSLENKGHRLYSEVLEVIYKVS